MPSDLPAALAAAPPEGEQLTDYDRAHLATYLKLLDAHALHIEWKVTARSVLALDTHSIISVLVIALIYCDNALWRSALTVKNTARMFRSAAIVRDR